MLTPIVRDLVEHPTIFSPSPPEGDLQVPFVTEEQAVENEQRYFLNILLPSILTQISQSHNGIKYFDREKAKTNG